MSRTLTSSLTARAVFVETEGPRMMKNRRYNNGRADPVPIPCSPSLVDEWELCAGSSFVHEVLDKWQGGDS